MNSIEEKLLLEERLSNLKKQLNGHRDNLLVEIFEDYLNEKKDTRIYILKGGVFKNERENICSYSSI
jgi:predicted DNA-binding protein